MAAASRRAVAMAARGMRAFSMRLPARSRCPARRAGTTFAFVKLAAIRIWLRHDEAVT
jgi:hypothetical protein